MLTAFISIANLPAMIVVGGFDDSESPPISFHFFGSTVEAAEE